MGVGKEQNTLMAAATGTIQISRYTKNAPKYGSVHSQITNTAEPRYLGIFPDWQETFFHYQVMPELLSPERHCFSILHRPEHKLSASKTTIA